MNLEEDIKNPNSNEKLNNYFKKSNFFPSKTKHEKEYKKDIEKFKSSLESINEESISMNNSSITKKKKIKKKIKSIGKLTRKLSYQVHPITFRPELRELTFKKRDSMFETEQDLLKCDVDFGDNKFVSKKHHNKNKEKKDDMKNNKKTNKENKVSFGGENFDNKFVGKKNEGKFINKKIYKATIPTFQSMNDCGINYEKSGFYKADKKSEQNMGMKNVSISKDIPAEEKKHKEKKNNNQISDFDFDSYFFIQNEDDDKKKEDNLKIPKEFNLIKNDLNVCLFDKEEKNEDEEEEKIKSFLGNQNIQTPTRKRKDLFVDENINLTPPSRIDKSKSKKKENLINIFLETEKNQKTPLKQNLSVNFNFSEEKQEQIMNPNIINIKSCTKTPVSNKKKINFPSSFSSSLSNIKLLQQREKKKISQFEKNFEMIKIIGKGSFGEVYKCQNKYDKLFYAVKIIKKMKRSGINEAQALASLNVMYGSNYIVRYFSSWEEKNKVYIVMECCSDNLKSYLERHSHMPEQQIRRLIKHICKALKKLHSDKIVHLDIKPGNILLSNSKHYKLSDLGLVKALYDKNDVNTLQEGDSKYMASELLNDISFNDVNTIDLTKADIFSLGMTIYKCMLGKKIELPLHGPFWKELRNNKVPYLDTLDYSNSLKRLVLNMIDKDPKKRPSANEIIKNNTNSFKKTKIEELRKEIESLKHKLELRK